MSMEKLSFTIDPAMFDSIVSEKQKAFVASIKSSEIQDYFYFTLEKEIDVKYFNCIEFKTITTSGKEKSAKFKIGFAEIDFLIPSELLNSGVKDLTTVYDSDNLPPVEIVFQIKERID